jgi:anti-sigma factor (TIGR02949 family)
MDCHDVLLVLLDYQQGRLAPEAHGQVRAHLDGCPGCAHEDRLEHELTQALERRLPQHAAPLALKRRLAAQWPVEAASPALRRQWLRIWIPATAVALILLSLGPLAWQRVLAPASTGSGAMVGEAINDHIRLLQSERPLEIESGGIHQVIPWFSGRLDFSPTVRFSGDPDFPLRGGAIGYFVDRRAAALVYGRRLHTVSVFIFRADGLPWPRGEPEKMGRLDVWRTASRGFNVLLWRDGELGFAAVSDVDPRDLSLLVSKLAGPA